MSDSRTGSRGSVCILRHSFYPSELNVKREAEALHADGFRVHVICLRGRDEVSHETIGGIEVHRLPVGHQRGKILRYLFEYNAFFLIAAAKVTWLHAKHNFKAIQVNTMPDYLVFATLVPKLLGTKVIIHMHEPIPELFNTMFDGWYNGLFVGATKFAEKISLAYADRALTVTREMRENFGRRGADVNKITVIVNVPDDKFFRLENYEHLADKIAAVKKEERRQGIFRILTHGAVEERYGQDTIVEALAVLRKEVPGARFRFMGGGSYLNDVMELAAAQGVSDSVTFLGFVPFETMIEEILTADVTIVPQKSNTYSNLVHTNKMYEYVALQRPVVASDLSSTMAYFDNESIVFYRAGDPTDLAEKIKFVYAHPEEMSARIDAATEIYETYRWEREKRKYLGVYHALLRSTSE